MYIGKKYTATSSNSQLKNFRCPNCGHKCLVEVTGVGQGQGSSPFFLDKEGAIESAEEIAHQGATKNILQTLSLAKCPKCNKRNKLNVRHFWFIQSLKLIGSALFVFLIGFLIYGMQDEDYLFYIFTPISLLMIPFIYFIDVRWRWFTVDARITFFDVPDIANEENLD